MPDDKYNKNEIGFEIGGIGDDTKEAASIEENIIELDLERLGQAEEELIVDLGLPEGEVKETVPERLACLEARVAVLEERLDALAGLLETFISPEE